MPCYHPRFLGEVIAFNEEAAERFSDLTSGGTMSGVGMAHGARVREGVMCESEFASPWLAVLSAGFVQEVTPSHKYCV